LQLDGHAKGGGALSAVAQTNSPITFIATGERFDDLEKFEPSSFVSRLLGMGDMKGLMETFKERTDLFDKAPAMAERIAKGVFTLRDMRDQFQGVLKMGNLSQVRLTGFGCENVDTCVAVLES
jgi:signal recognition particle subunit SRP54